MRRQFLYITALVISVAICTSSVFAATNQNLQWGISDGQRFDYSYYREVQNFNDTQIWDFQFYNIVDNLSVISDDIDNISEIPVAPNRTCYYENGTETSHPYKWYVIPIGNFDLIIDLWLDHPSINESNIIDTPQLVGYNCTWSWDDWNNTYIYAEIYSKSTGVLHTYQSVNPISESFSTSSEIVLIPGDDILPDDILPVIYIAVAGGVVIILVAIFMIKRK